jgi:hypothetical protein
VSPPVIEAQAAGRDLSVWRRLLREGRAAYRIEARGAARRRTHLQSAKILDGDGGYLCDAIVQDVSELGMRLLLARNCGLPSRFGVHMDLTGEVVTGAPAWRRERLVGVRVLSFAPPAPIKPVDRAALKGRYYGVRG